jgi:hypothetical protein
MLPTKFPAPKQALQDGKEEEDGEISSPVKSLVEAAIEKNIDTLYQTVSQHHMS